MFGKKRKLAVERPARGRVSFVHDNYILRELKVVANENGLALQSNPPALYPDNEWNHIEVRLSSPDEQGFSSAFRLQQMPGCCAILTVSYVRTNAQDGQEGFDFALSMIEEAAKRAAFGSIVLTQVVGDIRNGKPHFDPQEREPWAKLPQRGYVVSEPFLNAKSGNYVSYLTYNLGQEGKKEGFEKVTHVG